jgi:hypothetical protein
MLCGSGVCHPIFAGIGIGPPARTVELEFLLIVILRSLGWLEHGAIAKSLRATLLRLSLSFPAVLPNLPHIQPAWTGQRHATAIPRHD